MNSSAILCFNNILKFIIIIVLLIITSLTAYANQEMDKAAKPVIECLGIPEDEYGEWQSVIGLDIWLGYPEEGETPELGTKHGFAIPEDAGMVKRYRWDTSIGVRYVWIFYSESTPEHYYVFPFKTMEAFADANGNYMGVHPCGAYMADRAQIEELIS